MSALTAFPAATGIGLAFAALYLVVFVRSYFGKGI